MQSGWSRRQVMAALGHGGLGTLGALGAGAMLGAGQLGCVVAPGLGREEHRLLFGEAPSLAVVQWNRERPDLRSVLRKRAAQARSLSTPSLRRLDERMRETLKTSRGVGLAAPQVGVARRVILVELQREGKPVITCVDPVIPQRSPHTVEGYEACLSVEGVGGLVKRAVWVDITYLDLEGRPQRIRSTGWEARIFQHEVDHLDGVLYLDRLAGPLLPIDEVRRRRRQGEGGGDGGGGGGKSGGRSERPGGEAPSGDGDTLPDGGVELSALEGGGMARHASLGGGRPTPRGEILFL